MADPRWRGNPAGPGDRTAALLSAEDWRCLRGQVWERRRVAEAAAVEVVPVFVVDEAGAARKVGGEVEAGLGSLLSPPSDSSTG